MRRGSFPRENKHKKGNFEILALCKCWCMVHPRSKMVDGFVNDFNFVTFVLRFLTDEYDGCVKVQNHAS